MSWPPTRALMRCCWSWMTTTWLIPGRSTSRWRSCWRICRRACGWWCPAGLTRRCRWRGCGPAAGWLSCAPPTCASPARGRRRCWGRRRGRACRPRRGPGRWAPRQRGRVQALHRAAAAWCEEHDLADDAVRHALAAGDTAWAARLVERHVETLLGRSEGATLRRWLSALPAQAVRDRPRLCLAQAYGAAQGFQAEALEALLDDAHPALAATGDEPYQDPAGRPGSVLANVPAGSAFLRASLGRPPRD